MTVLLSLCIHDSPTDHIILYYAGKMYYSCTSDGDPDSRPWCSLRVDRFGNHVSNKAGNDILLTQYTTLTRTPRSGSTFSLQCFKRIR